MEQSDRLFPASALAVPQSELLLRVAFNYGDQRQFRDSSFVLDRALQIRPDDVEIKLQLRYRVQDNRRKRKYLAGVTHSLRRSGSWSKVPS